MVIIQKEVEEVTINTGDMTLEVFPSENKIFVYAAGTNSWLGTIDLVEDFWGKE